MNFYMKRFYQVGHAKVKTLITLRVDVDYPYSSRLKSFIYTALNLKPRKGYLRNSKIIASMVNESPKNVKAYWFFTPKTLPDYELLKLLKNDRHEIGLHIVNDPFGDLKLLEKASGRKINYYTVHGTARMLGRIIWKRWRFKEPKIPNNYPLKSFYEFPTFGLDVLCYSCPSEQAFKIASRHVAEGYVLHFHPIWLFQKGKINYRGPFYETLRRILDVDHEFETLHVQRKMFFAIARDAKEYERDVIPTEDFLEKLEQRGVDVFTFIERGWCSKLHEPPETWIKECDNIALLHVASFEDWWNSIGKKTRNMVRKAEKSGVKTDVAKADEKLAEEIWKIYNETPIRQDRGFPHYGTPVKTVKEEVLSSKNSTYIGAYLQDELLGFIQLVHGENIAVISQILALQRHWDKAVNNALIAKAVEFCAQKKIQWIMYGRIGNHPSLDKFKQNNGFTRFQLWRYYIPLTRKGRIATRLGLHRDFKDALPQKIKYPLIPIYNWISRTKMKAKIYFTR